MSFISTFTGHQIFFDDISKNVGKIDIQDIAHALSMINRYNGHTMAPYSVALHSVFVSRLIRNHFIRKPINGTGDLALHRAMLIEQVCMQGLLHDATEAYVGDVTSPLKNQLSDYARIEEGFWGLITSHFAFGLDKMQPVVTRADRHALFSEGQILFLKTQEWAFDYQDKEYFGSLGFFDMMRYDLPPENTRYSRSWSPFIPHDAAKQLFIDEFCRILQAMKTLVEEAKKYEKKR